MGNICKSNELITTENVARNTEHTVRMYSLRPILLFANMDVSIIKMYLDTSTLAKSIMDRRE
jgi:hypothetical protein